MQIVLYSGFKKRENSTKLPSTTTTKKTVTGYLREPCSIMQPVFKIERLASDASPSEYTFAYISAFSRYYFVTDWVWKEGLWECHLDVDVLASFRTDVGNVSAYIERCASESDGTIIDSMYPATADFDITTTNLSSSWHSVAPNSGCFVVGILGIGSSLVGGATSYYVFTRSELNNMLELLMSNSFLEGIGFGSVATAFQQLTQETAKSLINPLQYITSCTWFPIEKSAITGTYNNDLLFGYWNLNAIFPSLPSGKLLTENAFSAVFTGTIPEHPQASTRGEYLNYSPFTKIILSIPPFGSFPIDPAFTSYGKYVYGKVYVDTVTGKATMKVLLYTNAQHSGNSVTVYETSGMMGIPISISQAGVNYLNTAESIIGAVSSGIMGNYAGVAHSIGNAIDSTMPTVISKGADGSFLGEIVTPTMTIQHFTITDENNAEFGRPLCTTKTISTLSGYIKCLDADVDFSCYEEEKTRLVRYMTSGFFWE